MKIFLRDAGTRMLRSANEMWTSDTAEAFRFESTVAAVEAAARCGERDIEVVLRYEDPVCELVLNPAFCVGYRPESRFASLRQAA